VSPREWLLKPLCYELITPSDLEETLRRYQRLAADQTEFGFDLLKCTWDDVHHELQRAQDAVSECDSRGEKFYRKAWRALGPKETVPVPSLGSIPNNLNVLQRGLVAIFSVSEKVETPFN
jgi:hypothetical protein